MKYRGADIYMIYISLFMYIQGSKCIYIFYKQFIVERQQENIYLNFNININIDNDRIFVYVVNNSLKFMVVSIKS